MMETCCPAASTDPRPRAPAAAAAPQTDRSPRRARTLPAALAAAVLALAVVGCGQGEKLGRVAGRVTFQGKPVPGALVQFSNDAQGVHMSAVAGEDGSYAVEMAKGFGLPLGEYGVAVVPPPFVPPYDRTDFVVPAYPNIPQRYRNPDTSGLRLTVVEGAIRMDVDMLP